MIDREELERLHEAATNGPWDIDSEYDEDGLYSGGGGCGRGFKNFFIGAEINSEWRTLLDTQNSDNKLIEEEYDEDSVNAWDAIGMANAELITYLRNAVPDILTLAAENAALTEKVERLEEAIREAVLLSGGYTTGPSWAVADHIAEPLHAALNEEG